MTSTTCPTRTPCRFTGRCNSGSTETSVPGSASREPVLVASLGPRDLHVLHVCPGRATAAPGEHRVNSVAVALELRLHRPVRVVAHPTGEAKRASPLPGLGAEEDALHTSSNH